MQPYLHNDRNRKYNFSFLITLPFNLCCNHVKVIRRGCRNPWSVCMRGRAYCSITCRARLSRVRGAQMCSCGWCHVSNLGDQDPSMLIGREFRMITIAFVRFRCIVFVDNVDSRKFTSHLTYKWRIICPLHSLDVLLTLEHHLIGNYRFCFIFIPN